MSHVQKLSCYKLFIVHFASTVVVCLVNAMKADILLIQTLISNGLAAKMAIDPVHRSK